MRTAKDLLKTALYGGKTVNEPKPPTEGPAAEPSPTTPGGVGKGTLDETKTQKPLPMTSWAKMGLTKIPKP